MSNRAVIESQVGAIQTQLQLLRSLLQQEETALCQQHALDSEGAPQTSQHLEIQHLRDAQQQLQAIEAQLQALRDRLRQIGNTQTSPCSEGTLSELRGILKGKAQTTEVQIREAQIRWDWGEECDPNE